MYQTALKMDKRMVFINVCVTILHYFEITPMKLALACEKGYNGTNCNVKCPYPTYGLDCQSNCNCIDKDCDHINGCNRSKEHVIPSSIGLIYSTLTSEYMTSKVSIQKKFLLITAQTYGSTTITSTKKKRENTKKKQEMKCRNVLVFPTITTIVVALIVVGLYLYTRRLENRLLVSMAI